MKNKLESIVEAILFVSGDGIAKVDILEKLEISEKDLDKAIVSLQEKYNKTSGVQVITYRNKVQMCSNSKYATEVAEVLNPIRERKLTKATLEALSIIAYKQPITRLEVENIRGVNSDYAINNLINHSMIEVVGRKDAIGKPMLFGTTDEFLKRFEIKDLEELPDYNELLESIAVLDERQKTLYNEYEIDETLENAEEQEEEYVKLEQNDKEMKEKEKNIQAELEQMQKVIKAQEQLLEETIELPEEEEVPSFLQNEENLEVISDEENFISLKAAKNSN